MEQRKIDLQKRALRSEMRARRASVTDEELRRASLLVWERLRDLEDFRTACVVHSYIGALPGEMRTELPIRWLIEHGRSVLVPRADIGAGTMSHVRLADWSLLSATRWGGVEPTEGDECGVEEIGLVLVPGVAFDRKGRRLGMGGGFYDRFLVEVSAPKIALAHDFQVVEQVPAEDSDVPVDVIVTPDEVIIRG